MSLPLVLGLLACGGSNRSSAQLAFAGDPEDAIAAVQAEIAQRGFDPKCKPRAFCVFEAEDGAKIHLKVAKDRMLLLVDVADAEVLGSAREAEVRRKAEALGREIWAKAAPRAQEDVRVAKEAAAKREAEEAAQRRKDKEDSASHAPDPDALRAMMESVQGGTQPGSARPGNAGAGPTGGVSVETRCCVNGQFLDCPVSQCADLGQCLMDCASKGSTGCEQSCVSQRAPSCKRVPNRDAECAK